MNDFIGINARSSDDFRFIKKFGFVREYHEWSDDTGFDADGIPNCPHNLLSFNPSKSEAALIDYDDFYGQLSGRVSPCMKWLAPEMRGLKSYNALIQEQKPICGNITTAAQELPESYIDYIAWVSVFLARYGSNKVCEKPENPFCELINSRVIDQDILGASRSGLGNLGFIELGNEPDKWWYDNEFRNKPNALWQMMPGQYAALLHAVYDGGGKNPAFDTGDGATFLGVKNIDPKVKVAMAGISDFRGRYLIELLEKAYALRATNPNAVKKIPFDILNIHHYLSNNPNAGAAYINNNALWNTYDYYGLNSAGQSPEQAGVKQRFVRFLERLFAGISNEQIKNELADMDFWLSEFGYDSNNNSPMKAKLPQNSQSYFTTQAQWLVRTYLELSAVEYNYAGKKIVLDKAAAFDLRDGVDAGEGSDYNPGGGLYTHCGLLTRDFKPKRAWYYVQTLKETLGDTRFTKDLNAAGDIPFDNGGTPPRIYYYKGANNRRILAIWSPTSAKVENRQLTLPVAQILARIDEQDFNEISAYTTVTMQDFNEKGAKKGYDVADGQIHLDLTTVQISETPVFVILGEKTSVPAVVNPMQIQPAVTAYCNGALLEWETGPVSGGHWKILYAKKNNLPYFTDCQDYKKLDLPGTGYIQNYSNDLGADRKRLLIEGLKANTAYVVFMVYVNEAGIPAKDPTIVCLSTNNLSPCVINPCLKLTSGGACESAVDDFCKLVIENTGAAYNGGCSGASGCISGNPAAVINCNTYASGGCGSNTLFQADQLWMYCNKPEITLTFENTVELAAIRFYHHSGISPVDIYYSGCGSPDEKTFLTTYRPTGCNQWVSLVNNLPAEPVKKLYFRKVYAYGKGRTPDVKIGQLHFCGEEVADCGQKPKARADSEEQVTDFQVFPNPTTGLFHITWKEGAYGQISVSDTGGVTSMHWVLPAGSHSFSGDLSHLPAGVYVIRLSGEGRPPLQRIIVLKGK
ncbi:MAG: T9SS type A sorting domain-containing protein [Saprospiraceae bacterium]|nr:T9SS type A sorting domain-containing protein [Saprospiraceae bacterium]